MSDVIEIEKPSTALAVIPASSVSTIVAADKDDILGKLARRVAAFKPDASTDKGRSEMRSLAYDISKNKQSLIKLGKGLTEEWHKKTKAVNAECKIIEERMDELRDKVRAPLTAYENAEKARVQAHEDALAAMQESPAFYATLQPSADVEARLAYLENLPTRHWQEFAQRAADTYAAELDKTRDLLTRSRNHEAEQAELARLRAEAEENRRQEAARLQAERDRQIAAEATERARKEAEAKAERERQETLRAAAEDRARVEREKQEAEDRAAQAERDRIAAEEAHARALEKAEADRIAAEQLAEQRRQEAAEQAERDRLAAVKAEQDRVAALAAQQERERRAREANLAHRKKINGAAVTALIMAMAGAYTGTAEEAEAISKAIVTAIAQQKIPHVSISY